MCVVPLIVAGVAAPAVEELLARGAPGIDSRRRVRQIDQPRALHRDRPARSVRCVGTGTNCVVGHVMVAVGVGEAARPQERRPIVGVVGAARDAAARAHRGPRIASIALPERGRRHRADAIDAIGAAHRLEAPRLRRRADRQASACRARGLRLRGRDDGLGDRAFASARSGPCAAIARSVARVIADCAAE